MELDHEAIYKAYPNVVRIADDIGVFDKDNQTRPMLINPGDKVKYTRINQEEYDNIKK